MRKLLFLLIASISIALIIILFLVIQLMQREQSPTPSPALPTPIEILISKSPQLKPAVRYDDTKTNELIEKAKNRQPLSANGTTTKSRLIAGLGGKSGNLYSSANIRIEYTRAPDLFQGEILTTNIQTAKQEAINWAASQGFTKEDVCNLPFSFYLSSEVSRQLQNSNAVFNPLPDGC